MNKLPTFPEVVEEKKRSPLRYILAVFLIFLLIVMIIPYYNIKLDPRPENIPSVEDVFFFEGTLSNKTYHISTVQDFKEFVDPTNPVIKRTANLIATKTCSGERVCQAKAMYYFVRDNIEYVPDPVNFEYVEPAVEVLFSKGADCESGTFLLASLLESIGVDTELVFVPKHAFLRAKIPDALKSYKIEGWVYLDWTCKNCEFGEIPLGNSFEKRTFLDVGR